LSTSILDKLAAYGVIPVIAIDSVDHALGLADALIEGGLPVAEITFRTDAAADVISLLADKRPELILGAGTVLTPENVQKAKDCGATFAVAPGLNPDVVKKAQEIDLPFVPGINNPTDIEMALSMGCKTLKFFPAEASGGIKYLNAISAPYKHTGVKFIPTGGVNANNLCTYLEMPVILACGGTWIAKPQDMAAGNWSEVVSRCKEVAKIVSNLK
jgi:2-dehydro-3-deoxyphosphogluconate aldolase/(4S)-4-hydroxy-2-oxoglutarate aldolase